MFGTGEITGEKIDTHRGLVGEPEGKNDLVDLRVGGSIMLK